MNQKLAPSLVTISLLTAALAFSQTSDKKSASVQGQSSKTSKASGAKPANQIQGMPPMMGGPGVPTKPPWKEFKLNPKTTMFLDFTDSNPDMIISIFSRTSGITIIKDPSFKIPLTVTSAKAVGLNEAFEIFNTVLGLNGYELRKQGDLMLVSRRMPPQQPPMVMQAPPAPVIKTYALQYADATQIARVINEVFAVPAAPGGGGGQPQGLPPGLVINGMPMGGGGGGAPGGGKNAVHASAEDYSNSVIVSALPQDQVNVASLIKDLDKTTVQPLQSELFHLNFVPADQVLSAVQDLLTSNVPTGRGAGKKNNSGNQGFFFSFNPFGNSNQHNPGEQTASAIKQTNSIIVNATKENIELVRKLLQQLDQPASYVGTTFVVRLENSKASDVADLLTKVFAQRTNNQDNNPFFFFSDFTNPNQKNQNTTDIDEEGHIVNVHDVVGKVSIVADPNTNSLIIETQPSNMTMIRHVIEQIDRVAEQVMIETIIVEANLDKTTKLGIEWSFLQNKLFNDPATNASGKTDFGVQSASPPLNGFSYTIGSGVYKAFLNTLQSDSRFNVLDTPRIFTSNNMKAVINVSQKLPYITTQQTGTVGGIISNYTFQDVGVVLTVTPRIAANGQVTMDVDQSADDLQGFTSFNAPIINHREATTTVSVKDGETVILGGIIRHTLTATENKIPFLGDLPIIGNLFKSTSKTAGQTELMVFMTPHIVHGPADAKKLLDQGTKDLSKPSQDSLKKLIPPPPGK